MNHPYRSLALLLGLLLAVWSFAPDVGQPQTTPSSGMRVRSSGTDLGRATIVDCTSGVTCTLSGSVWTLSASGGGGGAPATAPYITQTPDAGLSAEQALSLLGTGLMLNTTATGVVSIYAGTAPCSAGDFIQSLNGSGVATCATPAGSGTVTHTAGALTANQLVIGNAAADLKVLGTLGTTTTLLHGNAAGAPTFGAVVSADLNLTTTTCTNQFVTALSSAAAGTCTTATLASAQFANQGTTTTVLHGNAAGNPAFGAVVLTTDVSGVLPVANGGTGLASGTSGGVLAYTASGTLASSGALTANLPVIGGGAGVAPGVGTRSGNTTAYVTTTGTQTSGDCVKIDANGNHIANGSACGGGTSAVSVLALTSDATTNSTTTGVKITGLDKTTGTGTFFFQYVIRYQSAAITTGVKFGVNHTGTVTVFTSTFRYQAVSGAITAATQANASGTPVQHGSASARAFSTTAPNMGPTISVDAANADMMAIVEGLLLVTVDGNLELWHASEVAAASTVMTGSSLILTKTN